MKKYLILVLIVLLIGALSVGGLGSGDVWILEGNEDDPLDGETIIGNIIIQVDNSVRNKVIIRNCEITGNIEVISGDVTDIGPGNTITGNVEIGSDTLDTWVYKNPSIIGNVEAKGASGVVVWENMIEGNIELTGCDGPFNPGPDDADIWDNVVDGNIEIKDSSGYIVGDNMVTGEVEIE